jgi:hypothetical protein
MTPEDEATAVRAELGECTMAGDHEVVDGLCIHCGAEFEMDGDV